jgi:hypothetical protein
MALATNALTSYSAVGNREDLQDTIYSIAPTDTPIMSAIGQTSAAATTHEWQTDALASAATNNAQLEGDEISVAASSATTRVTNICQIMNKTVTVTGSQEAVNSAGRASELAYQLAKRSKELKRDIEATITANQGQAAGNATTARKMRGLPSWLSTNISKAGGSAANATGATAGRTDGTQRALTEAILKDVIKQAWDEGGEPTVVTVGSFNKGVISGFTGRSQARQNIAADSIQAAAALYIGDFGTYTITPNRFQRARDAFVLDPSMASLAYLRPVQTIELAKTADAEKRALITELTLVINNEAAHGGAFDLTTS